MNGHRKQEGGAPANGGGADEALTLREVTIVNLVSLKEFPSVCSGVWLTKCFYPSCPAGGTSTMTKRPCGMKTQTQASSQQKCMSDCGS